MKAIAMLIRFGALLLPLLAAPAFAQADAALTTADRLAAIIIGFTADGTAMVHGNETANVTRNGPGKFSGTVEETGATFTFEVMESAACVFDATYASGDMLIELSFDPTKVTSFAFEEQEAQAGYTFFRLTFEGADDAVVTVASDGTRTSAGKSNRIGSSLTLGELNAAVAELQKACPAA
jgi:hypothetical protein